MELTLQIPDDIAAQFDGDLGRQALEALAIEGYRSEKLSLGQVAEMLGISVYEADGLIKENGIEGQLTLEELNEQRQTLDALLGK